MNDMAVINTSRWHRWFAWKPVYMEDDCSRVWLKTVWRQTRWHGFTGIYSHFRGHYRVHYNRTAT